MHYCQEAFCFPTTRIEAIDSRYLQKTLGNSDIPLLLIIDLQLWFDEFSDAREISEQNFAKKTRQITTWHLLKLAVMVQNSR